MCACIPVVTQLLGSKTSTDIIESLQFLASAFGFKLKGGAEGVRKSLVLVWSGEVQIREALVAMYQRLYLRYVIIPFIHIYSTNITAVTV